MRVKMTELGLVRICPSASYISQQGGLVRFLVLSCHTLFHTLAVYPFEIGSFVLIGRASSIARVRIPCQAKAGVVPTAPSSSARSASVSSVVSDSLLKRMPPKKTSLSLPRNTA